jgi:hypothetical protein
LQLHEIKIRSRRSLGCSGPFAGDQPLGRDSDDTCIFNELLAPDALPAFPVGDCSAGHAAALSDLKLLQSGLETRLLDTLANPPFGVDGVLHFPGEIDATTTVIRLSSRD